MSWIPGYKSTIRQLSTPSLHGEILKLENSIKHLRRSNEELRAHRNTSQNDDTSWIAPIIAENEQVIAKQVEQIALVKQELSERGHASEHADDIQLNGGERSVATANDEQPVEEGTNVGEPMDLDESSNGLHL